MLNPSIFKSYDIRGLVPEQLDAAGAARIALAFATVIGARRILVAKDVRRSGPALGAAATEALLHAGVDVVDIGTVSTDLFYFAMGTLDVDGGFTISASHNPKEWNGFNFCRRAAVPLSLTSGLAEIRDLCFQATPPPLTAPARGQYTTIDLWDDFADYVLTYVDRAAIPAMRVVAHGNCGMQVRALQRVIQRGRLPLTVIPMYAEPDGEFPVPGGVPNPLLAANQGELCAEVLRQKADLGVAWDADGDRCFFVDETGYFISGYFATAILARSILARHPGATVVLDPRNIWATQETIAALGGRTVLSRAGMTVIPESMRQAGAEFAGEMSAHFYFRRNWYRDNGMIPLLLLLELLGREGLPLSAFSTPLRERYFVSGELNFSVPDGPQIICRAAHLFAGGKADLTDGLSIAFPDWRFNLRVSNTEPLLRLNVEARSGTVLQRQVSDVRERLGLTVAEHA